MISFVKKSSRFFLIVFSIFVSYNLLHSQCQISVDAILQGSNQLNLVCGDACFWIFNQKI
jgi:hypothetical protein